MKTKYSKNEQKIINEFRSALIDCKAGISDDCRAFESYDGENELPSIQVTFGLTQNEAGEFSWGVQTGDNSYSGAAYHHKNWGVITLFRRSNSRQLAIDAFEQCME